MPVRKKTVQAKKTKVLTFPKMTVLKKANLASVITERIPYEQLSEPINFVQSGEQTIELVREYLGNRKASLRHLVIEELGEGFGDKKFSEDVKNLCDELVDFCLIGIIRKLKNQTEEFEFNFDEEGLKIIRKIFNKGGDEEEILTRELKSYGTWDELKKSL